MAKEVLLESDITAGARLIEELDKKGADVSAALWFFDPDLSEWKLLLVSSTFEKNGLTASYTMVSEVISSIGDVNKSISMDNMKIVKNNGNYSPLISERRGRGGRRRRHGGTRIGQPARASRSAWRAERPCSRPVAMTDKAS